MSKSSKGVTECGRREREQWGHISPCDSTGLTLSGGWRSLQEGMGKEQHSHPTAEPREFGRDIIHPAGGK